MNENDVKPVQLTPTQLRMAERIGNEIKKSEQALKTASGEEKNAIEERLNMLKAQYVKATTPFIRTSREKQLIDKIADSVKENASTVAGTKVAGDRSDKKLSSKDNFKYAVEMYIKEIENRLAPMKKELAAQEYILNILTANEEIAEEFREVFGREVEFKKNMISQLKMNIKLFEERLELYNSGVFDWAINNYDDLSKLNVLLNDPLHLPDFEEYMSCRKKEFEIKE